MKWTLLTCLFLASVVVGCNSDEDKAEPQSAEQYVSLAAGYGADYDGLICDWYTEGQAFCADDTTFVYCSLGEWWMLDCVDDLGADFCGEDDVDDTVDCYVWI